MMDSPGSARSCRARSVVLRTWGWSVAVSSAALAVTALTWEQAWQSRGFTAITEHIPLWVFAIMWAAVTIVFTWDLSGRSARDVRVLIAAGTLFAAVTLIFAVSILWTTIDGSTSAVPSAVMWLTVAAMSLAHVWRLR